MAWRQAITWTNADPVHRRICAALGEDELTHYINVSKCRLPVFISASMQQGHTEISWPTTTAVEHDYPISIASLLKFVKKLNHGI